MTNPVEEFLLAKEAFGFGSMASAAKPYGKRIGEAVGMGAMTGLGGAAFAGLSLGAAKLYDAATKTHDFNNMMEANPDLHELHQQDPAGFNRMFSALRTMAPEFTKEPMVAGTYMRRGLEGPAEERGSVAVNAATEAGRAQHRPGPMLDAALGNFSKGVGIDRKMVGQSKTRTNADGVTESTEETQNRF